MSKPNDLLLQVADILSSTAASGEVRVNPGDSLTGKGWASDAPVWGLDGFASRPNDPDASGGCMCVYFRDGDEKAILATRDNRNSAKVGEMQPGDRMIISRGEARFLLKAETDSVTIYTANQQDDDSSMMLSISGDTGQILMANGGSYVEMTKDSITLSAGGSMLRLDASGPQIFGKHTALNSKTGNLGVTGGIIPPPGASSILAGVAGPSGVPAPGWTVTLARVALAIAAWLGIAGWQDRDLVTA